MRSEVLGLYVGLFVCLSVYIRSQTAGYETAHELYKRLKRNKGSKYSVVDFAKGTAFKSYSVKTKQTSQYVN